MYQSCWPSATTTLAARYHRRAMTTTAHFISQALGLAAQALFLSNPNARVGCVIAGADGRTLFLCVAPDFYEHIRQAAREAQVWSTRVEVPGVGF